MSISWNRSLKTGLATAGAATAFAALVPSTASADIVDEALAMVPEGQISCAQANQYWTTEAEYNGYVQQARGVAAFHPRGGEINEALARIDEAADRCGLKGGAVAVQETGAATNGQAATAVNAYVDDTGGAAIDQDAYDTDDGQNPGGQTTTPPRLRPAAVRHQPIVARCIPSLSQRPSRPPPSLLPTLGLLWFRTLSRSLRMFRRGTRWPS